MTLDRAHFLVLASGIAASSALAVGCDQPYGSRGPAPAASAAAPTPSAELNHALQSGPMLVDVHEATPAAGALACDDNQGTAEECPSVGPSDEGVCPNVIFKRCSEFKAAMKPRVAAQAVACLKALKGNDRCDPARINQCGHAALMTACAEPARPKKGQLTAASPTQPVSVVLTADATPDPSPVAAACASIMRACGDRSLAPTLADCKQTLAGMTDTGRANMVDCVSTRCVDGGLYACEAVPKAPTVAAVNH